VTASDKGAAAHGVDGRIPLRVAVLNGPNLNLLGRREPALYGRDTLADVEARLRALGLELGAELTFVQRNGEGELVDAVHALVIGGDRPVDGALVNAGAYSHTSLALRDALTGVALPFIEVHVTNVYAREPERRHSMLAPAAVGVVCGLGTFGYEIALRGLMHILRARRPAAVATAGATRAPVARSLDG
jgi:3-dehydroquinate dehydratase-2